MIRKNKPVQSRSSNKANDHLSIIDISEEKVKVEKINQTQTSALPTIIAEELELNLQQCTAEVKQEVRYILVDLLNYPSSSNAEKHRAANKLGSFDIKQGSKTKVKSQSSKTIANRKLEHCQDCGLLIQEMEIPICTSFTEFPNAGIATSLFFDHIKTLSILTVLLGCIYSCFATYINITEPTMAINPDNYPSKISYASKILNVTPDSSLNTVMNIEGWLLVIVIVVWSLTLYIVKFFQLKYERMIDDETITAADFSIMIENIPITCTQEKLQQELNKYQKEIEGNIHLFDSQEEPLLPFTIKKFCKAIPFHLAEDENLEIQIENLDEQIMEKKELFAKWIEEIRDTNSFTTSKEQRSKQYEVFEELRTTRKDKLESKNEKIKLHNNDTSEHITTTAFISFQSSQSANVIESINPQTFSAKLRYYLSCCRNAQYFTLKNKRNKIVDIIVSRAPQPEDIIWGNIAFPKSSIMKRKMLTYLILILLLGVSFAIVYGLTILQIENSTSTVLSIAVSLSITIINIIIGMAIHSLTCYEKDFTETNRQISIAIKSVASQLMNSILVPTITNIYIEKNLFEVDGLVYDVFYLAVTNAVLPPILRVLDIDHFYKRIMACWKLRPYQKITLKQEELNEYVEDRVFELGYSYIYFIDMFYFTCFYITMQPIISVVALVGFFFMYWAEKYTLLYRSKRPTPSSALLADAIGQLISLGPCILSLGTLTWFNLLTENYHDFSSIIYLSHLASCGLSLAFFLLPFNSIFNAVCYIPDDQMLNYEQCRLKLTSQYDRLNPVTMEEGLADFLEYVKAHKNEAKNMDNHNLSKLIDNTKKSSITQLEISLQKEQFIENRNKEREKKKNFKEHEKMNSYLKKSHQESEIEYINHVTQSEQSLTMNQYQRMQFDNRIKRQQRDKRPIRRYNAGKLVFNRKDINDMYKKSNDLFDDMSGNPSNTKDNKKTEASYNIYDYQ